MPSNSPLLRWSGLCAIVYGLMNALSYIARIAGIGYPTVTTLRPDPIQIMSICANPGVGISILIDWLSFLLFFPALVGIMLYLRWINRGLSIIGFTFGLISSISVMLSTFLMLGASDLLVDRIYSNPMLIENQAVYFYRLASYLLSFSLPFTGLFYLLWGFGFRKGSRPHRIISTSFLIAFLLLFLTRICLSLDLIYIANISLMFKVLFVSASFIMTGRLLRKDEEYGNKS
jgi:hypothetical protein